MEGGDVGILTTRVPHTAQPAQDHGIEELHPTNLPIISVRANH